MLHILLENGTTNEIDTANSGPTMVSIKELENKNIRFEIPVYQRGFRWTRQQIKELIDDLYEFSKDSNPERRIYCLQNITVRKKFDGDGEYYEVIDGQQRLTAIWILVMAYMSSPKYEETEVLPVYSLFYEEKEKLTRYVSSVTNHVKAHPSGRDILTIETEGDIDSAFINDAFDYVINEYKNAGIERTPQSGNLLGYASILSAIFNDDFQSGKKSICVIWNEINPEGDNESKKTSDIISRFSKINANKIPLTESELIKAYFIDKLDAEQVAKFSLQWEEMERGLNDEEFWLFITSGKDIETRMDLLFQVYLDKNKIVDRNGQHVLSRSISQELSKARNAYDEWYRIVQLYYTLKDWYNDYYYYHVIGLLIAIKADERVEEYESSSIIKNLYGKFQNSNKEEFKEYLKKQIRIDSCYSIPFLREKDDKDWNIKQSKEILLVGTDNEEISYIRNKNLVKPLLLLFNISLLLNAYNINPENAVERFSFKIYKSRSNPIEIEHINPQHLEGKKASGSEYSATDKKDWALKTIEIIENEEVKNGLRIEIEDADWRRQNRALIERIENEAQLNTLSNLTLIDKILNICYGDNFFKEKRNHVLAARFGNPVLGGDPDKVYKQSVIFTGTMWIFMRQYDSFAVHDADRWEANDRQEYIRCMQESIFRFLKPANNEETEVK